MKEQTNERAGGVWLTQPRVLKELVAARTTMERWRNPSGRMRHSLVVILQPARALLRALAASIRGIPWTAVLICCSFVC